MTMSVETLRVWEKRVLVLTEIGSLMILEFSEEVPKGAEVNMIDTSALSHILDNPEGVENLSPEFSMGSVQVPVISVTKNYINYNINALEA